MNESPDANVNADESTACPACGSENTARIAARTLTYRCRDCNNEFGLDDSPME
jgi:transposase-like protein